MDNQVTMDFTLDCEREINDNLATLISLVFNQKKEEMDTVMNKHEAYGIASEAFQVLKGAENTVKGEMDTFLKVLPSSETDTVQICGSIYAAAQKTAAAAVDLAAKCQKIMNDLYYDTPSPIEKAIAESEDDGFEEAEEAGGAENTGEEGESDE